jgi:hypothetical protein
MTGGTKAQLVGRLMLRPEGVTGPEAMAATGWPSISLPQQAAMCGLSYTTKREGRYVRYFAKPATRKPATRGDLVFQAVTRIDNLIIERGGQELGENSLHALHSFLMKLVAKGARLPV